MTSSYEYALIAIEHFWSAGYFAALFSLMTVVYLLAVWKLPSIGRRTQFLLHTIYLLWQSNVAFVAVVSLKVAQHNRVLAGSSLQPWEFAPLLVPAAALLYVAIMGLSVMLALRLEGDKHAGA